MRQPTRRPNGLTLVGHGPQQGRRVSIQVLPVVAPRRVPFG